jgi:hypothetical protein
VRTSRVSSPATQSPIQQVRVRDITSQDTRRIAPSTKPSASLPASRTPRPGTGRPPRVGMRGLGGGLLGGLGSVVADMIFPEPTADGTLDAAKKAGLVAPPAPKLPPPEKPKASPLRPPRTPRTSNGSAATAVKTSVKPGSQPPAQPEDPDLKKYDELRKTDPAAAKDLGMKIWTRKYRPAFAQPEIA